MEDPESIDANRGKQHGLSGGIQPRDACAQNATWHPISAATGPKNANKSAGYSATKPQVAQGKASFPPPGTLFQRPRKHDQGIPTQPFAPPMRMHDRARPRDNEATTRA